MVLIHAGAWMDFENTLNEKVHAQKTTLVSFCLYELFRIGISLKTGGSLVMPMGKWGVAVGTGFLLGGKEVY